MKISLLIFLMCIVGYMGFYIQAHQGFASRFNNLTELNALITVIDHPYPADNDFFCSNLIPELKKFKFDGGCRLSKESPPSIMFIGDSHTAHYYNAIWQQFKQDSVLMVVQTSCLPFASNYFLQGKCKEKYEGILSFLKANSTIKTVYLSGYWAYLMTGGIGTQGEHWRHAKIIDQEEAKTFTANGRHFLREILQAQKEIIFLKDIPDLDFNIHACFKLRPLQLSHKSRKQCWIDFANYEARVADYDKVINALLAEFPQIKVYDPRPLFCKGNKCIARDNKLPYYFNGDHLNHYGANFVIRDLRENSGWGLFSLLRVQKTLSQAM